MCWGGGRKEARGKHDFLESSNMIRDPFECTEARVVDSALNRPRRFGRRISFARPGIGFAAIATVVVLFYGVAGYLGSADMFGDHPRWRGMNRGPADFGLRSETVSFDAKDGIPLKAWWLPASGMPRGAVIIAHGIDHTRQVMLPRAAFLVRGGYDVLAMDLRGHGQSGGRIVSPGLLEARDILGALRYIRSRGDIEPVAALGVSYGAVACLIAAAESPEIVAVIADGAYPTATMFLEDISRHYLHDPRTNFWLRAIFVASTFPGVARATALNIIFAVESTLGRNCCPLFHRPAASGFLFC